MTTVETPEIGEISGASAVRDGNGSSKLPVGWRRTRLLDVTRHHSGNGKLIKGKLSDTPADDLFPAFSASGQDVWRTGYESEGEAIIVSAVGARCGKCFLATGKWSAIANTHVVWPNSAIIDRKFLWYRINDERFWIRSGSAQPFVVVRKTFEQSISLPPLDEQQRIVAEIEKQFTRMEAGVASLTRVQAALKRYRASVLKAACEGRLVSTEAEFAKTGNRKATLETGEALLARILTERRHWFDQEQADSKTKKKYVDPAEPEAANLPPLPEGWTYGTWNQISNWVTYGFTRPMPHVEEGIPIITAKGVNKGRIDFDGAHLTTKAAYAKLSEKDRPRRGDILVTKDGTIGRAAVVDTDRGFCINQSVAVIWLRSCPMERKFMLTVIESELTQKPIWAKARGVAIQHLSITDFAKLALPIPPLAEQTRIVAEVERRLSVVEELEAVVSANLQRATRLCQSILHRAFT